MSIEDIASQSSAFSRHGIQHDWKDTIFGVHVHVSPASAETLVTRGGITNHRKITKICWRVLKLKCATSVSFFGDTVY